MAQEKAVMEMPVSNASSLSAYLYLIVRLAITSGLRRHIYLSNTVRHS